MNWIDLCKDKALQDLPYKIELNKAGQIIMSPTRNGHGYFASKIARLLAALIGNGENLVECAVETCDGTKVADAVWVSDRRFAVIRDEASCSVAPEICVEVKSPASTAEEPAHKRRLYLKAGAKEYRVCDRSGQITFFDHTGRLSRSKLCPAFPKKLRG